MWFSIFPAISKRIVATSDATPDQVLAHLNELVVTLPRRMIVFPPRRTGGMHYHGRIGAKTFVIFPYLPVRHGGYLLTVRGAVEPSSGSTKLTITLQARAWAVIIVPLIIAEVAIVWTHADSPWLIPGFWILYHALGCSLVQLQLQRIRRDLQLIVSKDPTPASSPGSC